MCQAGGCSASPAFTTLRDRAHPASILDPRSSEYLGNASILDPCPRQEVVETVLPILKAHVDFPRPRLRAGNRRSLPRNMQMPSHTRTPAASFRSLRHTSLCSQSFAGSLQATARRQALDKTRRLAQDRHGKTSKSGGQVYRWWPRKVAVAHGREAWHSTCGLWPGNPYLAVSRWNKGYVCRQMSAKGPRGRRCAEAESEGISERWKVGGQVGGRAKAKCSCGPVLSMANDFLSSSG